MKYLVAEHGAAALAVMASIKRALDPQNIMNPVNRRTELRPARFSLTLARQMFRDTDLPTRAANLAYISCNVSAKDAGCGLALELALQTTLLGLAIAIILALVAALVGPLLLDWGSHRTLFEAEAKPADRVKVRVTGDIDARLLPSARLTLHDIQIGDGSETIRARSLGVEFALGSLMRGEWRAAELMLFGPQVRLGLDSSGRLQAPNLAMTFKPTNCRSTGSASKTARSCSPTRPAAQASRSDGLVQRRSAVTCRPGEGRGAVTVAGALYPYRLALGRV
jgi:hypothetical protein